LIASGNSHGTTQLFATFCSMKTAKSGKGGIQDVEHIERR